MVEDPIDTGIPWMPLRLIWIEFEEVDCHRRQFPLKFHLRPQGPSDTLQGRDGIDSRLMR